MDAKSDGNTASAICDKNWTDVYYDNLYFYYYEPQHIRRPKQTSNNGTAKISQKAVQIVFERLHRKEVPLNHLLQFFFSLCPARFIARVLSEPETIDFRVVSTRELVDAPIGGVVQPDLLFDSGSLRAAIEIKVDHKTELEQVLKYAFLMDYLPPMRQRKKLLFLGPYDFKSLWSNKLFTSPQEAVEALCNAGDDKLDRKFQRLGGSLATAKATACSMAIEFKSYRDLYCLMRSAADEVVDRSPGLEVYGKLLNGMCAELEKRGYCEQSAASR